MKGKKGMSQWLVIGIIAAAFLFLTGVISIGDSDDGDSPSLSTGSDVGIPEVDVSVNSLSQGSSTELSDNTHEVLLTSDDLNSENKTNVTFTVDTDVLNGQRASDGTYIDHILTYNVEISDFTNVVDSTDTSTYRPVTWASNDDEYDVTVGSTDFAVVNMAQDTISIGQPGSSQVRLEVADTTKLNKGIEETYDKMSVSEFPLEIEGQEAGSVNVKYMQTS